MAGQALGVADFDQLFRAHRPAILAYARRRVDGATAEDVVADTFLVCWRRLDDVPEPALPWLLGVARRCLANRLRAEGRRAVLAERVAWEPRVGTRDPADALGERERVLRAFAGLSEVDRELLALLAWERLEPAEVAVVLGCSQAALRVRLHRARRRLAARLEGTGDAGSAPSRLAERLEANVDAGCNPTPADVPGRSGAVRPAGSAVVPGVDGSRRPVRTSSTDTVHRIQEST